MLCFIKHEFKVMQIATSWDTSVMVTSLSVSLEEIIALYKKRVELIDTINISGKEI